MQNRMIFARENESESYSYSLREANLEADVKWVIVARESENESLREARLTADLQSDCCPWE